MIRCSTYELCCSVIAASLKYLFQFFTFDKTSDFAFQLKRHSLDQYILKDANKLYCVHYGNSTESGGAEFDEFFVEFFVCPATNDSNISVFLNNFQFNSAHTTDANHNTVSALSPAWHGVQQAIAAPATENPNSHIRLLTDGGPQISIQASNQPIVLNKADHAENKIPEVLRNQSFTRPISRKSDCKITQNFEHLCLAFQSKRSENGGSLIPFEGNYLNKNKTMARLDDWTNIIDCKLIE